MLSAPSGGLRAVRALRRNEVAEHALQPLHAHEALRGRAAERHRGEAGHSAVDGDLWHRPLGAEETLEEGRAAKDQGDTQTVDEARR